MVAKVFVFGSGDCGQLGLGEDIDSKKYPTSIAYLEDKDIVDISAGGLHSLALSRQGKVYSWGCNDEKALGRRGNEYEVLPVENLDGQCIVQIAAGDSISAALTKEGAIYTWGTFRDSKGVIGYSASVAMQELPTLMEGMKKEKVIQIAAGANHVVAVTAEHLIFSWGCGEQGQLGRRVLERHKMNALIPHCITPTRKKDKILLNLVACGSYHSLAVSSVDRSLYSWGLNNHGQLGLEDFQERALPMQVQVTGNFVGVAAGEHHSIALSDDGFVYAAGRGDSGQLGVAGVSHSSKFSKVAALKNIKMIAAGGNHNLAVSADNQLFAWGFGGMMQLGNGAEDDVSEPVKVKFGHRILKIQAGGQHSLLLAE